MLGRCYTENGYLRGTIIRTLLLLSESPESMEVICLRALSPRLHSVLRRLYGQAGFRNGSVSRDPVPLRQTVGRKEEIASRVLASHAQPFCNVQHIAKIYPAYYQRYTF